LAYTGAAADGWVGTCFVPEKATYYLDQIRSGATNAHRQMTDIAVTAGGPVAFTDDVERPIRGRKKALAFQVSAMGSATTNFYNNAFSKMGYTEAVANVRNIWLSGRRDEAVAAVPDELAIRTSMFGTDAMVRDRIRAYRAAGVTDLRLEPMGRTSTEKLDTLARVLDLVREVNAES
jgi:alkanesulfonate monooxygenase SsuD/methylene tetrahydromethanopterin reductase-like flavin-dependent oxidoreductase (luciferase family)